MKSKLILGGVAAIAVILGEVWLLAAPQAQEQPQASAPRLRHVIPALSSTTAATSIAPTVGTANATPSLIIVNTPTTVTVTVQINPAPVAGGVNLLQLGPTGTQPTIIGVMHDDGKNGDSVAEDNIFTALVRLDESYPTPVTFQVSAAFTGLLRRITSPPLTVAVQGLLLSTVVSNTLYAVEGTVASLNSYYSGVSIFTDLQITVTKDIKGSVPPSIVVRVPGGTVGADAQEPTGSQPFLVGQQVILLLDGPDPSNKYLISNGSLDVFRVQPGANGQPAAIIDPGYSYLEIADPLDSTYGALLQQSSDGQLSVDSLVTTILESQ